MGLSLRSGAGSSNVVTSIRLPAGRLTGASNQKRVVQPSSGSRSHNIGIRSPVGVMASTCSSDDSISTSGNNAKTVMSSVISCEKLVSSPLTESGDVTSSDSIVLEINRIKKR